MNRCIALKAKASFLSWWQQKTIKNECGQTCRKAALTGLVSSKSSQWGAVNAKPALHIIKLKTRKGKYYLITSPLNFRETQLILNRQLKLTSHESSRRRYRKSGTFTSKNVLLAAFGLNLQVRSLSTDWRTEQLLGRLQDWPSWLQGGKVNRCLDRQWQWGGTQGG